jgi:glutamate synthase domain-containing protein 3
MADLTDTDRALEMGMHAEQLRGRTQQVFFSAEEEENFTYPGAYEVDFEQRAEIDAQEIKHYLGVGILNRLHLEFAGSLGYFGCGLIDGPNIQITGRVGWSCAENMMAGTVVIEKNAGSTFGGALRGGDLVCRGDVGARTGVDQKGGTIIVGGRTGIFTGFMMQRGRMIILGDAGTNLGDSMYDGTIYVGGEIASLGVDAVEAEMSDIDLKWLRSKLELYDLDAPNRVENMKKIVAGKQLWNYDNLEPAEKKLVL